MVHNQQQYLLKNINWKTPIEPRIFTKLLHRADFLLLQQTIAEVDQIS